MAGLGCTCGRRMSDVDVPNIYNVYVFTETQLQDLKQKEPDLELVWLDYGVDYEYWHCPECDRVKQVLTKTGHATKVYQSELAKETDPEIVDENGIKKYQGMELERLFVHTDQEIYDITEEQHHISAFAVDFSLDFDYWYCRGLDTVLQTDKQTGKIIKRWTLEYVFP